MLRQRPRQHVDQLSQHVEATLTRLHALLLQLLVKSFDNHGDLQGETERVSEEVVTAAVSCFLCSVSRTLWVSCHNRTRVPVTSAAHTQYCSQGEEKYSGVT